MADIYVPVWMRGTPLEKIFTDAWVDTGDVMLAREAVRATDLYQQMFAGNVRDDGSVRYDEDTYLSIRDSYADSILSVGLNPDLFQNRFGDLIAGNVSPAEFTNRVETVYSRVIDAIPQVRQEYAQRYNVTDMSDRAILASFLDPDVGASILEKRIAISEIGAEASTRNFTVTTDFANRLYEAGADTQSEAAQFFGLAENMLPVLQTLAARHADPDDDFSLEEFAAGEIFSDPTQRRRIRTLQAQERASFSPALGQIAQSEGGGLTGLIQR